MARDVQGIVELASAYYGSAALFAAIDVDLFGRVERGEACDEAALGRGERMLADACVALGLLEKRGGRYANTPAGSLALVPGAKADLTGAIRYNRDVYPAWGKLAQFARTSRPVEKAAVHLGEDAARTRVFAEAMFSRAMGIGRGVIPMLGHLEGRMLDMAGGPGAYAILACQANPSLGVTTLDLPAISAIAREKAAAAGLAGRIQCVQGDFRGEPPERGAFDHAAVFGALHQCSPDEIRQVLALARGALKDGGTLWVLDMMTDASHTAPAFSALFALNMALTTDNGWVFSDEELKGWMRETGFAPGETRCAPPPMPHWLVSARAV